MKTPSSHVKALPTTPLPMRQAPGTGLRFPTISLGLWQNFGDRSPEESARAVALRAWEAGIFHFDLANNYGPPGGAAEEFTGRFFTRDLPGRRNELLLSTKAGYRMHPGPYGEGGSRKYLISSLESSLRRLRTDYVDIFYSHRFDPTTPLEETLGALKTLVDQGKALSVGISSYSALRTREALDIAEAIDLKIAVHQSSYSLVNRWIEEPDDSGESVLSLASTAPYGVVAFSPLAQGLLTTKYLEGIPSDSRAANSPSFNPGYISAENLERIRALTSIAERRGMSLAQLAVAWCLRDKRVSSVLIGPRTVDQLDELLHAAYAPELDANDLQDIDVYAQDGGVNLWASRSSDL